MYEADCAQAAEKHRDGELRVPFWGVSVSEPEGADGRVLIEHWAHDWLPETLSRLRPKWRVVSLHSLFETKTREHHVWEIWRAGRQQRRLLQSRDIADPGWIWESEGTLLPYEDAARHAGRYVSRRCDRALLFEYMQAEGIDLQSALGHRRLGRAILIKAIDFLDPEDATEPTRVGEAVFQAARDSGIGSEVTNNEMSVEERQAWAREQRDSARLHDELTRRLHRATSVKAVERALEWVEADWPEPGKGSGFGAIGWVCAVP